MNIVQRLAGCFEFQGEDENALNKIVFGIFSKDIHENNCLHYSYLTDVPEIRQILKDNNLIKEDQNKRNVWGRLPKELRHPKKC